MNLTTQGPHVSAICSIFVTDLFHLAFCPQDPSMLYLPIFLSFLRWVCLYHVLFCFIYSSVDGPLSWLHLLAIVNNVTVLIFLK